MTDSIRIAIFSEDRLFRDGLVKLLAARESTESHVSLAGVSDRWEEIGALKEKASIDVLLLDYKLFNRDDLPLLSTLSSGACPVKTIWIRGTGSRTQHHPPALNLARQATFQLMRRSMISCISSPRLRQGTHGARIDLRRFCFHEYDILPMKNG